MVVELGLKELNLIMNGGVTIGTVRWPAASEICFFSIPNFVLYRRASEFNGDSIWILPSPTSGQAASNYQLYI